jgi:HEPN domain-containing protein
MEELGLVVPRTHVLKDIQALLVTHYSALIGLRRGLTCLTRFAVETRYPGDNSSKRQAAASLRWASKVRHACRNILGL